MQVVQRDQPKTENFFRLDEMANIAAHEFPARRTSAVFFYGPFVEGEFCVLKIESARGRECSAISSEACRQHTIEHVHSPRDHLQHLRRRAESHRVTWLVRWQERFSRFNGAQHFLLRLS